jgi:hypothetical protein
MPENNVVAVGFISRSDYPDLCKVSVDFPKSAPDYSVWIKRQNDGIESLRAQGIFPIQVNVKPLEMAAWCKLNGLKVDSNGRAAYAAALVLRQNK